MSTRDHSKARQLLNSVVFGLLLIAGVLTLPPIFKLCLSNGELIEFEQTFLTILSTSFFLTGALFYSFKDRFGDSIIVGLFGISCIVYAEFGFRIICRICLEKEERLELEELAKNSYASQLGFVGHPFVNYTNKPAFSNGKIKNSINAYGFGGTDHPLQKQTNEYRIAALGGSTTASGYPELVEKLLAQQDFGFKEVSVLNFGIPNWTSAHSMVNYLLNVVEFKPDMLVIHHGWNDGSARNCRKDLFRADYSHRFKVFKEFNMLDAWPTRVSLIYRYAKNKFNSNSWKSLGNHVISSDTNYEEKQYLDSTELAPYKRNLSTIIDHAIHHKIKLILTTMPHSTKSNVFLAEYKNAIEQSNIITRKLNNVYGKQIDFVDLDSIMTGKHDSLFVDVGHLNEEGKLIKAILISQKVTEILCRQ